MNLRSLAAPSAPPLTEAKKSKKTTRKDTCIIQSSPCPQDATPDYDHIYVTVKKELKPIIKIIGFEKSITLGHSYFFTAEIDLYKGSNGLPTKKISVVLGEERLSEECTEKWEYLIKRKEELSPDKSSAAFLLTRKKIQNNITTECYDLVVVTLENPVLHSLEFGKAKSRTYFAGGETKQCAEEYTGPVSFKYFLNDSNYIFTFGSTNNSIVKITSKGLTLHEFSTRYHLKSPEYLYTITISSCQQYIAVKQVGESISLYKKSSNHFDELVLQYNNASVHCHCTFVLGTFLFIENPDNFNQINSFDLETGVVSVTPLDPWQVSSLRTLDDVGNLYLFMHHSQDYKTTSSSRATLNSIENRVTKRTSRFLSIVWLEDAVPDLTLVLRKLIADYNGPMPEFSCKLFSPYRGLDIFDFFNKELVQSEQQKFLTLFDECPNKRDVLIYVLHHASRKGLVESIDDVLTNEFAKDPRIINFLQELRDSRSSFLPHPGNL